MTKKDDPGKDPKRTAEPGGIKKPVPTIDLKATEIKGAKTGDKPADASKDAGKASTSASSSSAASAASTSKPATGASVPPTSSASKDTAASATAKDKPDDKSKATASASAAGAGAGKTAGGKPPPSSPPPKAKSSGSGIGSFISHATAGIIGGFLALLGADTLGPNIAPQLGLPSLAGRTGEETKQLNERLAALESAVKSDGGATSASPELVSKLAAAEKRIGELEGLQNEIAALKERQSELASTAESLGEKVGQAPEGGVPSERIAKLEQQLATIAAAAERDPEAQGIPQLAAVSGRVADLEQALENQINALRAGVSQDIDQRIATIAEASEQAKSGTTRIDRQLAGISTDTARLGQSMATLKADTARLGESLRAVQEETGSIRSSLNGLKGEVETKIDKLATPDDISQAISPVNDKISSLEKNVTNVVQAEADRQLNAQRIVLSLELANLKRALDRGDAFDEELGEVKKASGGLIDLSPLERFAATGVATQAELESSFRTVAHKIIDADTIPRDGSVFDQLLAGAKSVVRVRKVNHDSNDNSAEAVVGRMEKALAEGQFSTVLEQSKKLSAEGQAAAQDWLAKVAARQSVDEALGNVESQLKSSLGGGEAAPAAAAQSAAPDAPADTTN